MSVIGRQVADRADEVPNQAADVIARLNDPTDPDRTTLIDLNGDPMTEWISVDSDVIQPIGGEMSR